MSSSETRKRREEKVRNGMKREGDFSIPAPPAGMDEELKAARRASHAERYAEAKVLDRPFVDEDELAFFPKVEI